MCFSVPVLNKGGEREREREREREMSLQADRINSNHSEFTVDFIFLVAYAQRVSERYSIFMNLRRKWQN
jgi:hypothetical protein